MRVIEDMDELKALTGEEIAVGDWFEIDQARIEQFAEATHDRQWIHVDPERARTDSPLGGTIAHGYLTLSLFSFLIGAALEIRQLFAMVVNYGINKLRFISPVRSGSRIRLRMKPLRVHEVKGGYQVNWEITVEIEGQAKPACVGEVLYRYYE